MQAKGIALRAEFMHVQITIQCHCLCLCGFAFATEQFEMKEQSSKDDSEGVDQVFQGMPHAETEQIRTMVQESRHEV